MNSNISCRRYTASDEGIWNTFVEASRNGTFLHDRQYLDYHADRFPDSSLILETQNQVIALLPATASGGVFSSHAGLTYGGLIVGRNFHACEAVPALEAAATWASTLGCCTTFRYKPVPHIYHRMPAEEDLYALFRLGAKLVRRDLAMSLRLGSSYPLSKGRKWSTNKAHKSGIIVRRSDAFATFMAIEEAHLMSKHGVRPVHSASELELLASRFPERIRLYAAFMGNEMLGGIVIYVTHTVVHAQYIGATAAGKDAGAIDACISYVLASGCEGQLWFDLGTSMLDQGRTLDENLIGNKETWGARSVTCDHYELAL